jgi:hypothetical protein
VAGPGNKIVVSVGEVSYELLQNNLCSDISESMVGSETCDNFNSL